MNLIPKRNILTLSYIGIVFIIVIVSWKLISQSRPIDAHDKDLLNCDDFKHLSISSLLGKGWTKIVYKGSWRDVPLAVKTVNSYGYEMNLCKKMYFECMASLKKNLAEEMATFHYLDHPNIIKLYGSCLDLPTSNDSASGAVLVELGQPLTSFSLVQKDFSSRIKLAQDLCSLLVYLGTFPTGPILVPDLRLQQFVVAGDHLKLADVDDLQFGERSCFEDSNCIVSQNSNNGRAVTVGCKGGKCAGLNDVLNVQKACQSILPYLLSFGAPKFFRGEVNKILECDKGASWPSVQLELAVQGIIKQFHASTKAEEDDPGS